MWSLYVYVIAVSNYMSYADEWWMDQSSTEEPSKSFPFWFLEMTEELTGNVSDRVQRLVILNKAQLNGFGFPSEIPEANIARQIWSHLTWA